METPTPRILCQNLHLFLQIRSLIGLISPYCAMYTSLAAVYHVVVLVITLYPSLCRLNGQDCWFHVRRHFLSPYLHISGRSICRPIRSLYAHIVQA